MLECSIFINALERETAAERSAFLDEACAHDPALRQRVEALLLSHDSAGTFLGKPVPERLAEQLGGPPGTAETQPPQPDGGDDQALELLAPSDKPGSLGKLGHYEVQEVIGRGGMGIVLRAFDERLHRVVAIKVMAAQLATSAAARKRFIREAQAAAAVSHDHVVTIHAVEEAGGLPHLAMQYVSGMSLEQRLDKSGPLELREIIRIGMQTAAGLAAAHAQGLIHRDIKPANILLENGGERVKITDFGLARTVDDVSLTQTGLIAGTPQYMSPEQARGEQVDRRSDLFSLGSVLYAMCTGRPPFRADSGIAVLKLVCDDTPRPIRETNPDIPEWLEAIVARLNAKDPAQRYQSAAEVAELLNEHLAQLQHPSVVPLLAAPVGNALRGVPRAGRHATESVPHKARRLWATAAAVLLCIAAGLGLTEAAGLTKLTDSVIRVLTPEGTLIVEVDDPGVKVTIEGDGGLVITGAGLHEVRLKPGSYKLQADKNGQPVPLERELVSIAKGGREVVKVKLEAPPVQAVVKAELGAFVVLAAGNERKFDTLTEAVLAASDGDTIEIRGNGPFVTSPITSGNLGLTLRAAAGFRPIVQFSRDSGSRQSRRFANTASLTLEGLEFRGPPPGPNDDPVAFDAGISLHAANCRFLLPQAMCFWSGGNTRRCVLRNCEFLGSSSALAGGLPPGGNWLVDNCIQLRNYALSYHPEHDNCSLQLTRCTCVGSADWDFPIGIVGTRKPEPAQTPKVVQLSVSGCVLDCKNVLGANQEKPSRDNDTPLSPQDFATLLQEWLKWSGGQNVYRMPGGPADRLLKTGMGSVLDPPHGPADLAGWREFWRTPETGSLEGRVRFEGGNLIAKLEKAPHELTPDDFRLREGSAGYRAGPDGKDLGADVDLVGPGPAYERWKKTPEYQEWLKETNQSVVSSQ